MTPPNPLSNAFRLRYVALTKLPGERIISYYRPNGSHGDGRWVHFGLWIVFCVAGVVQNDFGLVIFSITELALFC